MTIIDRYLLRQFLKTFIICYISLTGLYVIFDAFTNLEEFLRVADKAGGLAKLMGRYYALRSVMFFDRTSNILVLVSAMFTITWFQRHNEMTALMAAGVSRARVVKPIIYAAVLLSVAAVGVREFMLPRIGEELSRNPRDLMGDMARKVRPRNDDQTDVWIRGQNTYSNEKRIEQPNFWLPRGLDRYGPELSAENAYYKGPEEGRPGGYLFVNVKKPPDLDGRASLELQGRPILLTPHDAKWLEPKQCFVVSEVTFDDLAGDQVRQFASTWEMIRGLRNSSLGYGADVRVAVHARIVQPFLDVVLLFLGMPLVVTRESRNVFTAIGMCVLVVAGFLAIVIGCQYMGTQAMIRAATAAWLPLLIFVPIATWLGESIDK